MPPSDRQPDAPPDLAVSFTGKRILVAVTGGVACYKVATVVSRLSQAGAAVQVIMTASATRFVGPATFQALSGRPVYRSMWIDAGQPDGDKLDAGSVPAAAPAGTNDFGGLGDAFLASPHIALARWCDVFVLAPATADTLAKLAQGRADDLVSLTASALPRDEQGQLTTPALFAPAMNADMWRNPVIQQNATTVKDTLGFKPIGPGAGWQACRTSGAGRMAEAEVIIEAVRASLGIV